MKTKLAFLFFAGCFAAAWASEACAQGKGAGMGRGLGHAASGSAAAVGRAGPSSAIQNATGGTTTATSATAARRLGHALPRSLNQVGGVAPGVGRSARGLDRSPAVQPGTTAQNAGRQPSDQPRGSFERIQQYRLQQADHLRGVAERNGNEHLLDTADRMEASAIQNYQRQSGELPRAAAPTPEPSPEVRSESVTVSSVAPAPSSALRRTPKATPKRGFWFGSR